MALFKQVIIDRFNQEAESPFCYDLSLKLEVFAKTLLIFRWPLGGRGWRGWRGFQSSGLGMIELMVVA